MLKQITGIAAVAVLLAPPAHAAFTKCVYLNPNMSCMASKAISEYNNKADWDATCTDSTASTNIEGTWSCSNSNGGSPGSTINDFLPLGESGNKYCWCRMAIPAVSQWVFHSNAGAQGTCHSTCGSLCLEGLQEPNATEFKTAMFSNLRA